MIPVNAIKRSWNWEAIINAKNSIGSGKPDTRCRVSGYTA